MKILKELEKFANTKEGKNNDNHFGRYFGLNFQPYCALAISYCAIVTGNSFFRNIKDKTGKYFLTGCTDKYCAYVPSLFTYVKRIGLLRIDPIKNPPKSGDIIMFSFGNYKDYRWSDHVGVVVNYNASTRVVRTLEANTSSGRVGSQSDGGGVYYRDRSLSTVTGWFTVPND